MSKIIISKYSALRHIGHETQGSYWNRLAQIAREMMKKNMTSVYAMGRLAFIAQELPVDFDSCDHTYNKKSIFREIKEHLTKVNDTSKKTFRRTYLAHKLGYEDRLSSILPKE